MAVSYPYDPTGVAASNHVVDELHSVQPPSAISRASFIVLRASPFFLEGVELYTGPNKTGTRLIPNKDYFYTHKFVAGTIYLGRTLFGSITFTNQNYAGNVYASYNTLGGDFVINDASVIERITNEYYKDIRFVTWDQIKGVPSAFPPDAHQHPVTDIKTLADVAIALENIAAAILASASGSGGGDSGALALITQHLANQTSAHTSSAVGLGRVANYSVANEAEALALRSDRYMTPAITGYLVARYIANQNIGEIRNRVTVLEDEVKRIKIQLADILAIIQQQSGSIADLTTKLSAFRRELDIMQNNIGDMQQQVLVAMTTANTAIAIATAADANMQAAVGRVHDILYVNNSILPVGNHLITIPSGSKVQVTLIGAGAGSGRHYTLSSDGNRYGGNLMPGEESVLFFMGTRQLPLEPTPIAIAGGGAAGMNNWGEAGPVAGGAGGKGWIFRTPRIKVSELKNINLKVDLIEVAPENFGTKGTNGDSANTSNDVPGVGGFYINATGDKYRQMYGKSCPGHTKASLGGSGAKAVYILDNDSVDDVRIGITVGRHGTSARNAATPEMNYLTSFESNGIAIIQLVN